jgi:hypothetical protein
MLFLPSHFSDIVELVEEEEEETYLLNLEDPGVKKMFAIHHEEIMTPMSKRYFRFR